MKKIYALFMTLCLVISATAGPLVGTVKGSYPLDTKVVTSAKQLSLDATMQKAPAATQGMQYDATEGDLIRYYNESDALTIDTTYASEGQLSIRIVASDNSDLLSLVLFAESTVPGTIIPEGTYPITSEPAYGTAYASPGVQNGNVYPSFYGMLSSTGGIKTPLYFLESGNVVVEVVNGKLKISIDAANSNNVPMTIVYEVGGKSEKVEVKAPLKYDATEGELDVTYGADATVELTNGDGYSILTVASADATNEVDLAFFYDAADPETVIPVGTYTIDGTYGSGTVLASSGVNSKGQVTLSFYANLSGGQLVTPLYFFVDGTVEVSKVDGYLKVEVNATNSNDVPIHIVYDATPAVEPEVELPAASVRAWAYDLALAVEDEQYTFSYKATTAAKATLIFTDSEGVELSTVDLGVVEAGANSKVLAASELPEAAEINWAIKLEAGAVTELVEVTDQTRGIYDFYNMMDVLVDNNTESEHFGKIYIQMAYNGASDGATDRADVQTAGLFIYDQELNELNDPSNVGIKPTLPEGYTMGDNRNKFHRLEIDPKTGKLAYCYNIAGTPAVFAIDRANLTGEVENLIAGVEGLNQTCALAFDAEGTLYVMNLANSAGAVYKIVDGQAVAMFEPTGKFVNASMSMAADGMGGLWIAQNRGQIDTYYQLVHVTKDGELDYTVFSGSNPDNLSGSSTRGALVYDAERQLLAQGRNSKVEVYSVAYNAETGVPSLTLVATTPTVGSNIDGLAFDYAGDLYVVNSSKEKFQKFAMPTENNACTTPASSKYAIELGSEDSEYALEETVEISNLTTATLTVGETTYLQLSGRNDMLDCDVQLFLNNYTGEDKEYEVNAENSLMTFGGLELTVVEGKLAQTTDDEKGAVYTGRVIASAEDEGEVMLIALDLIMYSTPAIEVTIEDAVARVDEETGALILNAEWTYEGVTYPVFVSVAGYEDVEFKEYEGAQISEIQIGSDEEENSPWFDFAVANAVAVIKEGVVITVEGEYTSWSTGKTYVVTANGVMQGGTDPEYEIYEDEITNMAFDLDNLIITGGPSTAYQVQVVLALGDSNPLTGEWQVKSESSVSIMGIDATFVEGTVFEVDAFAPSAKAIVRCEWNGQKIELHLTMSAAPMEATVVVVENATIEIEKYQIFGDDYDYALNMSGVWHNEEDGLDYPVLVEVPVYYPEATEPFDMLSTVTVGVWGDEDPWLGFGEGTLTVTTVDNVITATGIVQNPQAGIAIDITISGKLAGEDPDTALENATVVVKAVKLIKNGQLIINKGDVEYNAQGTILK